MLADADLPARRLVYFHIAGCFALEGEDFAHTFRLDQPQNQTYLPLFAEIIRSDRREIRPAAEVRALARTSRPALRARRPSDNPVRRVEQRFNVNPPWPREQGLDHCKVKALAGPAPTGRSFRTGFATGGLGLVGGLC